MENEVWKDIPNFEGYQISNLGRVKSFRQNKTDGKILKPRLNVWNYLQISLIKDGKTYSKRIHRLVMETFQPLDDYANFEVDHIDHNKQNNTLTNLRWITKQENLKNRNTSNIGRYDREKPVYCYETGTIYKSQTEAARLLNIDQGNIGKCCKGKAKSVKGLHFIYYTQNKIDYSQNEIRKKSGQIYCIELDKTFNTVSECAIELNLTPYYITRCCKGQQLSTGGYHFKYV